MVTAAAANHKTTSIALVGSVARGTDRPDSDCDFLCEFAPGTTPLDVAGFESELKELLGCKVQISTESALASPYDSTLDDAIPLFGCHRIRCSQFSS